MKGAPCVFALALLILPSCTNSDNLELLTDTLKTMQRAACDDETVSLACPRGTSISIAVAQYGRAHQGQSCTADVDHKVEVEVVGEKKCKWPNSMQYSLLQTVVEACQKKPQCKFSSRLKPGLTDPCPMARKFVEVEYRCRPSEFRSRTGCEGDVIKLSCNPYSRVAIYEAQYGRIAYDSVMCPQAQGVPDENCKTVGATETVMQICHGKRRCQVAASSKTFRSSCTTGSKPYLKVVYACVPLGVLTERYESAAENDETVKSNGDKNDEGYFDESDGEGDKWGEPNVVLPRANPAQQPPEDKISSNTSTTEKEEDTSVTNPKKELDTRGDSSDSNTKLFIYIGIAILVFIVILLFLTALRFYINYRSSRVKNDVFYLEMVNSESYEVK